MKVKQLIKRLEKLDQNAVVGTFASDAVDFTFTPIAEILQENGIELHGDFRGPGKKRFQDWVVLVGMHQKWKMWRSDGKVSAPLPKEERKP